MTTTEARNILKELPKIVIDGLVRQARGAELIVIDTFNRITGRNRQATTRRALPQRRNCETFDVDYGGLNKHHTVTVGFYDDGTPGEVFIDGGKSGEQVQAIAHDGAVLLSMALQHGVSLDTIRHAITRDGQGQPSSIVGVVVDRLAKDAEPMVLPPSVF